MYSTFGKPEPLNEATANLYRNSELTKLQEFYGLSFNDMFSEKIMDELGVSEEHKQYILSHRDVEFARKETEAWTMKANLFKTDEWKRIKDYYGVQEQDIRDKEKLIKLGLKEEEIIFIM